MKDLLRTGHHQHEQAAQFRSDFNLWIIGIPCVRVLSDCEAHKGTGAQPLILATCGDKTAVRFQPGLHEPNAMQKQ